MKLRTAVITAAAALPLLACGAAPDGDLGDGTSAEAVSSPPGGRQPPRLIDFDNDGFGSAVTDFEDVSSVYTLRGVTFACEGQCFDHGVFARAPGETGNGLSVRATHNTQPQPEFDATLGIIRATFVRPASAVTIDAMAMTSAVSIERGPTQGAPWFKAYDVYGKELDEDNYNVAFGNFETLSIASGSYDIAYVEFSSSTATATFPTRARFDNLTFDQAPLKQPPLEPAPTGTPVTPPPRLQ